MAHVVRAQQPPVELLDPFARQLHAGLDADTAVEAVDYFSTCQHLVHHGACIAHGGLRNVRQLNLRAVPGDVHHVSGRQTFPVDFDMFRHHGNGFSRG